tara:strand:- start:1076 stop:1384 length:309 start_codon:yes stop_codon:yes gene_type:complete
MKCCYLCGIPFGSLMEYICKIDITEKVNALKDVITFKFWKFKLVESKPYKKLVRKTITTSICSSCACNPITVRKHDLEIVKKCEPQYIEVPSDRFGKKEDIC